MQPIVCRLNPRLWWIVIPNFLMSLAFIFGPSNSHPPEYRTVIILGITVGLVSLSGATFLAADTWRSEIIADEQGLRWRAGWSGWKSARWDEISNFYVLGNQKGTPIIETPRGQLWLSARFLGIGAIVDVVPQRATKATAREWEVRDYRRDEEWEQTIPVWSKSQIWAAPFWTAVALYLIGYFGYALLLGPKKLTPLPDFQWFDILGALVRFLFFGALGILGVVPTIIVWRERKFAWAHRDELLNINARGIAFESDERRVEATWDEVRLVEKTKSERGFKGYRVITENGEFILWSLSNDKMFVQFRARCENYAPDALEPLRREEAQYSFDSEINSAPVAADGARTFSFRTRGNRLILLCAFSALGLAPFIYLISVYNATADEPFAPSWLLFGALCALAILVSGALWRWFARAFIVASADELRLHWPFCAVRRVRWENIESVGADAWGNWIRVGGRKIYWALGLFPARRAELSALLEGRGRAKS